MIPEKFAGLDEQGACIFGMAAMTNTRRHVLRLIYGCFGAASMAVLWIAGNLIFLHDTPFTTNRGLQSHLLIMLFASLVVLTNAANGKGPAPERIQQAVTWTFIIFGCYALFILLGRQQFSRSIFIVMVPLVVIASVLIIWFGHKRAGVRMAVVRPLVKVVPSRLAGVPLIDDPNIDFRAFDLALVDFHEPVSGEWARALSRAMLCGCRVRHVEDHLQELSGAVSIDRFELEHLPAADNETYIQLKRVFDVITTLVLIPAVLPILILSGLAILLTEGPPVFFIQERIGLGGRAFKMWKLRTMRPLSEDQVDRAAVAGDARITGVGRVLRRARIDELPQLWNVLIGDMSLIGPRPEAAWLHHSYTETYPKFAYRCLVRPGITGWAQVNAPPSENADEAAVKLSYDLYYVKRQSFALDTHIALRTIWAVLHGLGVR